MGNQPGGMNPNVGHTPRVLCWVLVDSCKVFHHTVYVKKFNQLVLINHNRKDFPGGSDSKASAYNVGDPGLIPRSGRSSGEGNGNPLQYACLENPMDRGA